MPEDITGSFYRGKVNVTLKDSVFQASNSFRSILELIQSLESQVDANKLKEMKSIFLMTDGGPEHNVTFESVKIPLMLMFKKLKVDLLVAIRTAPGQSYINVVERIMSILNLGLQNVACQRESAPSDETIKKCKNLEDLRRHAEIKEDWLNSLNPLMQTIEGRIKRLSLKGEPFEVRCYNFYTLVFLKQNFSNFYQF